MAKKKLLVCGVTGFIGRNAAEYFAQSDEYTVVGTYYRSQPDQVLINNPNIELVQADLTNRDDVTRVVKGADVIVQAAATTSGAKEILGKPYYHVTDNALMNSLLFRACFEHQVKNVIFFSCTVMYQGKEAPVVEEDFNHQISDKYFGVGWTKVYLEKMCDFYSRISKTKYTVIRHSNIYGPHDKYDLERSHVFGATVTKVMTAKNGKIVVWGEGTEERDLLHVDDLVRFVDLAIQKQTTSYELLNVGLGESVSVRALVEKIIAASGRELKIEFDTSKPTIQYKLAVSYKKAFEKFGWEPQVSLEEGIQKTLDWYRENVLPDLETASVSS